MDRAPLATRLSPSFVGSPEYSGLSRDDTSKVAHLGRPSLRASAGRGGFVLDEALHERERGVGDLAPAAVDRQGVATVLVAVRARIGGRPGARPSPPREKQLPQRPRHEPSIPHATQLSAWVSESATLRAWCELPVVWVPAPDAGLAHWTSRKDPQGRGEDGGRACVLCTSRSNSMRGTDGRRRIGLRRLRLGALGPAGASRTLQARPARRSAPTSRSGA
jgi:hypothetical protein